MHQCNITDNGEYAFYTSSCSDTSYVIDAEDNWWGTNDPEEIEALIWHHADYASAPTVDYTPCADQPFVFDIHTDVFEETGQSVPSSFALLQNYPNPFNSATTIAFELRVPSIVRIEVFDLLGRPVARLASEFHAPGHHTVTFNGKGEDDRELPSGVYFYRLAAGQRTETRKMVLLQ